MVVKRQVVVPLAVLGVALVLWRWPFGGTEPVVELDDDVQRCAENLRAIHAALVEYERRTGHAPEAAGVAFLAELVASGVLEDTPANRARLSCPGPGSAAARAETRWSEPATLTEDDTAYAARDARRFPLAKFPSGGSELEPIAACDGARGPNHAGCINLLQSDGSVVTLELATLIARGLLPPGADAIPVGPDSPLPELRKLVAP